MNADEFWTKVARLVETGKQGNVVAQPSTEEQKREFVSDYLTDMDLLASAWYNEKE